MKQQHSLGRTFEEEVRRVARLLWPAPSFQGAVIQDNRERDGLFITEDTIHVLEATTLRTKAKAQEDIDKTSKLVSRLRKENPDKVVKGWFVTKDDLTADQNQVASQYKRTVQAIPFKDFLSRLVDARTYLTFREKCAFGSVADPVTNHFDVPRDSYVAPSFFNEIESTTVDLGRFSDVALSDSSRTILLGDFGAGKSMALRELFFRAAADFYNGKSSRFPVYLNLRNHIGQDSPVEALIREATNTGYGKYDDLVKAWRADLTVVILDGFDELVTPAWTQRATQLREHRAACTKLVAAFVKDSPALTPVVISGRLSYFGSQREMERAIRLNGVYNSFRLNDFTRAQASQLLTKLRLQTRLPDWLPSRPLLLGYLAAYAAGKDVDIAITDVGPAEGWDYLLDRICIRESEIHNGLYAEYIRRLLERIGTKGRYASDITSPISQKEIAASFREIFERDPNDSNLGMLMRLPGLVAADGQNDERRFVDSDYAHICAAGDVHQFVLTSSNTQTSPFEQCRTNIQPIGADFIVSKLKLAERSASMLHAAVDALSNKPKLAYLKGDLTIVLAASDAPERDRWTIVDDASIETLDVRQAPPAFRKIRLAHSAISTLEIDEANPDGIPQFQGCIIDTVRGPPNGAGLDKWLNDTTVERFEFEPMTNNAILDLDIPVAVRVGLTALRKLYLQPGGGRQENAFQRGLKPAQKPLVPAVLEAIVSCGYASLSSRGSETIYLKNSDRISDVHEILAKRAAARGPLMDALKRI